MEYKIGELAREFDITLRTLRHYESRGLISPKRSGNTRYYSDTDRDRLRNALFAKRIGLQLSEIPAYLDLRQRDKSDGRARATLREIYENRLKRLKSSRRVIDGTIIELSERLSSL